MAVITKISQMLSYVFFQHNTVTKQSRLSPVTWASLVAQMVKNSPAVWESRVQSLAPWRREWQLTPIFLPGEFHGQRILVGYNGVTESQTQLSE